MKIEKVSMIERKIERERERERERDRDVISSTVFSSSISSYLLTEAVYSLALRSVEFPQQLLC